MDSPPAIQINRLSKTFGRGKNQVRALNQINLTVQAGQVFGFLGPNGAGKTTSIRLLMRLIRPTNGDAHLFGEDVQQNPAVLKRVGALVEGANFYNFLNGYDNLAVLARTANDFRPDRIRMLLEQVGLAGQADRRVKGYSTGMKQRLGIAAALLSEPELVILDEPTNGLDPAGIQEMRGFIRGLTEEQGKTVFLSSHHLNEVEQICDAVAIINKGEIVRQGDVTSLLAIGNAQLRLQVSSAETAARVLGFRWPVTLVDGWLHIQASPEDSPDIIKILVDAELDVHQAIIERQSLEEYFLEVTNGNQGDAPDTLPPDLKERADG